MGSRPSQKGIHVTVEQLRRLKRDALRLSNAPADTVNSLFPGSYRALFHGRGIEFDEVRSYQWGDDYRTLDWRVTARTGELHTKLYHEERERTLHLVLDAGASMQFGTKIQFKWVYAAQVAALFAWLAIECGDRVAASVFGDGQKIHYSSPGGGEKSALKIFHMLAGLSPRHTTSGATLAQALAQLRRLTKPGSLILLISDFNTLNQAARDHLAHLGQHNDLAGIQIFDPLEAELPPPGLYPITDGAKEGLLNSRDPAFRWHYHQAFQRHCEKVRATFNRLGARSIYLGANQPLVEGLRQALQPTRQKRVALARKIHRG